MNWKTRLIGSVVIATILTIIAYSLNMAGCTGRPQHAPAEQPKPEVIPTPNVETEVSVIFVQQKDDPGKASDFKCVLVKKGHVDTCYAQDADHFWKQVEFSFSLMVDGNTKVIIYEEPYAGEGTMRRFERLALDAGAGAYGRSPKAKYAFTEKEFMSAHFLNKATERVREDMPSE